MSKIDFKKEYKHLYGPSGKRFEIVDVPALQFLMIDGHGDPNVAQEYADALEALYAVAYKLKFTSKRELDRDYIVPALEGLWWAGDMDSFTAARDKSQWDWTMMILQPDWISQAMVQATIEQVGKQKDLSALATLRLETYHEGLAVQIMYTGSYDDEGPTIACMHACIEENGYAPSGKHHEIYLSDPRRTAPDKLKTVIRQPIRKLVGE